MHHAPHSIVLVNSKVSVPCIGQSRLPNAVSIQNARLTLFLVRNLFMDISFSSSPLEIYIPLIYNSYDRPVLLTAEWSYTSLYVTNQMSILKLVTPTVGVSVSVQGPSSKFESLKKNQALLVENLSYCSVTACLPNCFHGNAGDFVAGGTCLSSRCLA
jgi:hypothetical protein